VLEKDRGPATGATVVSRKFVHEVPERFDGASRAMSSSAPLYLIRKAQAKPQSLGS